MNLQSNLHIPVLQAEETSQMSNLPKDLQVLMLRPEQLSARPGIQTGIAGLDNYLLWQGVPQGEISLFQGLPGTGATSLWIRMLQKISSSSRLAAWVNSESQLLPSHLIQANVDLQKVLVVNEPKDKEQMFWVLQELITSSLFETVGCHLKEFFLKNHQLQKLKRLARVHKVALVFISQKPVGFVNPLLSLMIDFKKDFVTIKRALHRPVPYTLGREQVARLSWNGYSV